ncbi:MAG: hypothetical protein ACLS3C_12345 [Oscillospiraceae bacterium]
MRGAVQPISPTKPGRGGRLEFFGDQGHLVGENIIGQIDGGTLDAMFCGEVGGYDAQQDTKDVKGEQLDVEFAICTRARLSRSAIRS